MIWLPTLPDPIFCYPSPYLLCSWPRCCSWNRSRLPLPRDFAVPSTWNPLPSRNLHDPSFTSLQSLLKYLLLSEAFRLSNLTLISPLPPCTLLSLFHLPCFNFPHGSYPLPEHQIRIYLVLLFHCSPHWRASSGRCGISGWFLHSRISGCIAIGNDHWQREQASL